ncbi:MAG TPA: hypothetical protein VFW29_06195 [Solirubrobacteraceae bacterium]|nr:hypothetical protein [Solirubrobacteraceae bacterium]
MGFDLTRLGRADRIIGVSAVLFFIFLFFVKWYGGSASSSLGSVNIGASINGWHAFHNSRWIWLLTIIVALGAVAFAAGAANVRSPASTGAIVTALGALSTLLVLYRIVHHPHGGFSGTVGNVHVSSSYGIRIGIWLGLIAAAGVTYGGYEATRGPRMPAP